MRKKRKENIKNELIRHAKAQKFSILTRKYKLLFTISDI